MSVVLSLDMHFDIDDSTPPAERYAVLTTWGLFRGPSWLDTYDLALRARRGDRT